MKSIFNRFVLAAFAYALFFISASAASFQTLSVKSETELGKWGASWWLWALSAPENSDPISDTTGKSCAINQAGKVWFLAGTYENGAPIKRQCTIPAGKAIMFPLVNTYGVGDTQAECTASLQQSSAGFDRVKINSIKIDNKAVSTRNLRGKAPCFYLSKHGKWLGVDGYWVIAQLTKGKHTLSYSASTPSFRQNVTYSLTQK